MQSIRFLLTLRDVSWPWIYFWSLKLSPLLVLSPRGKQLWCHCVPYTFSVFIELSLEDVEHCRGEPEQADTGISCH